MPVNEKAHDKRLYQNDATSMSVVLTNEQIDKLLHKLIGNENDNKMLLQLENMIRYEAK